MKAMVVTGFVPNAFPAKHLNEPQCRALGNRLEAALPNKIYVFDNWTLDQLWAYQFIKNLKGVRPSDANPPADRFEKPSDMVISNAILLQRFEWVRLAAELHPDVDVFAWLEYTIFKQRGITEAVVQNFVKRMETIDYDQISLPGCWPKSPINDAAAHWRFCGSAWVCPRKYVEPLAEVVKAVYRLRTLKTNKASWDMNTMAYVELLDVLPIRWYKGNHDETQLTNF